MELFTLIIYRDVQITFSFCMSLSFIESAEIHLSIHKTEPAEFAENTCHCSRSSAISRIRLYLASYSSSVRASIVNRAPALK